MMPKPTNAHREEIKRQWNGIVKNSMRKKVLSTPKESWWTNYASAGTRADFAAEVARRAAEREQRELSSAVMATSRPVGDFA